MSWFRRAPFHHLRFHLYLHSGRGFFGIIVLFWMFYSFWSSLGVSNSCCCYHHDHCCCYTTCTSPTCTTTPTTTSTISTTPTPTLTPTTTTATTTEQPWDAKTRQENSNVPKSCAWHEKDRKVTLHHHQWFFFGTFFPCFVCLTAMISNLVTRKCFK